MRDAQELTARADAIGWFHRIDLGQGVVTKGLSSGPYVSQSQMPDMAGKSVLDIGAWDGFYSFMAERLGASRVVSMDHYVWGVDMAARQLYWQDCADKGVLPDHNRDTTDFWRPDLPGRRAFDFAREVLDSKVEPVVADFASCDLGPVGRFDVVLYLGVLYHMKEPLTVLERLKEVTKQVAVIETQAVAVEGLEAQNLVQFFGGQFVGDYGNWYVPTLEGLRQLALAAGFTRVVPVVGPPVTPKIASLRRRLVQLGRRPTAGAHPALTYYRAVIHAHV
ncbi:MAG: class I SAM-dependent methyltransferase [Acidimicrobiales bacterium]